MALALSGAAPLEWWLLQSVEDVVAWADVLTELRSGRRTAVSGVCVDPPVEDLAELAMDEVERRALGLC